MGEIVFWVSVGAVIGWIFSALCCFVYKWIFYGSGEFAILPMVDEEGEFVHIAISESSAAKIKSKKFILLKKKVKPNNNA